MEENKTMKKNYQLKRLEIKDRIEFEEGLISRFLDDGLNSHALQNIDLSNKAISLHKKTVKNLKVKLMLLNQEEILYLLKK